VSVAEPSAGPIARARARVRTVSPETFRVLALVALASLFVVVVTGAVVRLTASGLGCDNWPRCGQTPFPEKDFHALVEFGNRVVALVAMGCTILAAVASRRVEGLPRYLRTGSAVVAVAIVAQIPLGGLTVIFDLNPVLVMSHFFLALAAVGLAVVVALGADRFVRGAPATALPWWLGWLALGLVPVNLAVVVTGALSSAAGPHSGGSDIKRIGILQDAVYVHVRATAVFGVGFLLLLCALWLTRAAARAELLLGAGVLGLLLTQMAVGEIQWRNALPWWLVLIHVGLATAVWSGVVALAARIWTHPRAEWAHAVTLPRVFSR
jgi:cytochrome c oxidase assembly protein subunit 15